MSLVKSMRKNSSKIMVFLLIFIMVGFVLGASLPAMIRQISNWFSAAKPVAIYGENVKVDYAHIDQAQTELKILRDLMAVDYLNMPMDQQGTPNIKNLLLSQVLFPDPGMAAMVSGQLKYMATSRQQNSLQASEQQIDTFFSQTEGRNDISWLLLKAEAQNAGIAVSDSAAKSLLRQMIPAFSRGGRDAATLVNSLARNYQKSPEEIIKVFSDLLSVMTYASTILTNEDVTIPQVKSIIGLGGEKIKAETVRFQVSPFEPNLPEPTNEEITAQFNKYKDFTPGVFTKENHYGFGYKQPATAVIEYIIVKLDDVKETIDAPTPLEMEDYYRNNIQRYTSDVPVDPNAPDGEKKTVRQNYSDVVAEIRSTLIREKTSSKADQIMVDAIDTVDKGLAGIEIDKPTSKFYKEHAGDYEASGKTIAEKYAIPVYTGKTGKLSAARLATDSKLGMLLVPSTRGRANVGIDKVVFAIDELGETKLGRFDPEKPKMWQNIGPLKSGYQQMVALVRVVGANKGYVPENPDLSYDVKGAVLDKADILSENIYNLKDDIIRDLKEVSKMKIAKEQAEEFVALLETKDWDEAIKEFNDSLATKKISVEKLKLSTQQDRTRSSLRDIKSVELRSAGMNSSRTEYMNRMLAANKQLQQMLYGLIPQGEIEAKDVKAIIESQPQKACFVVKDVSLTQVTKDDYKKGKSMTAFQIDMTESDSLALIHFAPDNIIERMGFEWTKKAKTSEEPKDGMNEIDNEDKDEDAKDGEV
ncbi:MAG: hypothetical protein K9M75_06845 [Phycisphaerae bacterium]|nr:hypothetical protein [Phycisphaerae bacterium]